MERRMLRAAAIGVLALTAACAQNPESPVSPSAAAGDTAANPDGSTLKVSAPVPVSPEDGSRTDSVRPTVRFRNSQGRFTNVPVSYRVQVFDANGTPIAELGVPQDPSGETSLSAEADLTHDTEYRWRVRAEYQGEGGPWSPVMSFRTVERVVLGNVGGAVGPPRNIVFNEAYDILYAIYSAARWDLSGRSSRDQLNLYLEIAVAALHYGHGKWNPKGPDSGWCIKNGGPGRPQSDDVLARCDTRDAWDLVLSIGGPNPVWSPSYIGRLPNVQQIYAPRQSVLALLP
jgi:hypothetical protein